MSFSQSAATNIVPLIARLVLAAVFIPAGYNKLMREAEFSGEEAKRLRELSVIASADADSPLLRPLIVPAALRQEAPSPQGEAPGSGSTPPSQPSTDEGGTPAAGPTAGPGAGTPPTPGAGPASGGQAGANGGEPVKARALHKVTLMVDKAGWPYQTWLAWAAAVTEFVGGACLILGLFTRVWGLGLAIAMVVAFYLTSLDAVLTTKVFGMPIPDFNRFASQLALFALSFGLLLTGAGGASIDRRMGAGASSGNSKKPAASAE
jgi:uncharacterized membrane protein YphA (DoxX/SURF4 family)